MKQPSFQVLNFFYDEENSCALTIPANRTRFHIIADVNNLGEFSDSGTPGPTALHEYLELLERFKSSSDEAHSEKPARVRRQCHRDGRASLGRKKTNPKSPPSPDADAETALYKWLISPPPSLTCARPRAPAPYYHLLHQIARKRLHDRIRCPRLDGIATTRRRGTAEAAAAPPPWASCRRWSRARPPLAGRLDRCTAPPGQPRAVGAREARAGDAGRAARARRRVGRRQGGQPRGRRPGGSRGSSTSAGATRRGGWTRRWQRRRRVTTWASKSF